MTVGAGAPHTLGYSIAKTKSVEDAMNWASKLCKPGENVIFRGQPRDWSLLPALLRDPSVAKKNGGFQTFEDRILELFKQRAYPFLTITPTSNFDWLVLAQHHGCVTRLLDWTGNLLVALFFAVEKDARRNGVVWSIAKFDPFAHDVTDQALKSWDKTGIYMPKHITTRITAQSGAFTVHPLINQNPTNPVPFEESIDILPAIIRPFGPPASPGSLAKAVIPARCKKPIRDQLDRLAIHRAALFPGLDGISDYINRIITL